MSISKQLINGFVQSEFELFKKDFDECFVPEIQDIRSTAIAWLCYYFKESITSENSLKIIQYVDDVYSRENYSYHGWLRISALQAAAYILTSDIHYANILIQHIDCMQSWARSHVIRSAGIICPLLSFNNQYLKKATENNIKYSHFYYEENILLFLSTKGRADEKRKWLEQQIQYDKKAYHTKLFNRLKTDDKYHQSGFFISAFSNAKSYLIFKILSKPHIFKTQPEIFDEAILNFEDLKITEKKHPLSDYYIDLSFLKNE